MKNKKDAANIIRFAFALPVLKTGIKATKVVMNALGVRRTLGVRLIELSVGIAITNFTDKHAGAVIAAIVDTTYDHFFKKKSGDDLMSEEDREFFDREEVREDMKVKVKVKMMKEEENG